MIVEVGWKLCDSCVIHEQRVLHGQRALLQAGWRSWTWPKFAKDTFVCGVVLSREPPKLQQA